VAEIVVREGGELRSAIFAALDGKPYGEKLWTLIEPSNAAPIRPVVSE
jgi:hypothetical protein